MLKTPSSIIKTQQMNLIEDIFIVTKAKTQSKFSFKSKIINGDILETLNFVSKNDKFDVIIIDPPYNIGKNFGNNDDNMEIGEYIKWSKKWLNLCLDILANNGLIYVYGFPEILARIATEYPIEKQRILAWHYTNKTTPCSTFWQRSYESILCLWKNNRPALEIDQIREPYTENYLKCAGKERKGTKGRFGNVATIYNVNDKGALPRDVIKIPALAGGAGKNERHFMCKTCNNKLFSNKDLKEHREHIILHHPTQKPMSLTKKLMLSRINSGNGKVLIPFAGSGSECVVAKELGIDFL